MEEKSVIKSVFCSYRGSLIVYDVHGNRVDHLCDKMTLEIYNEIEERSMEGITTYGGLEKYRCIVCELKEEQQRKEEEERANSDTSFDPFNKPPTPIIVAKIIHTNGNAPPPVASVIGDIWCENSTGTFRQWDGTSWNVMSASGGTFSQPSGKIFWKKNINIHQPHSPNAAVDPFTDPFTPPFYDK